MRAKPFKERGRVRLHTLGAVRQEMCALYRAGQRGEIPWNDAARACYILTSISKLDQGSLLDQRLTVLEQKLGVAAPNGHTLGRPVTPSHDWLPPQ
jgi:hypothetical protein